MKIKFWVVFLIPLWLAVSGVQAMAVGQDGNSRNSGQGSPHDQGLAHFKRGFYEFLPKDHKAEAAREFEFAIAEFEKALALDPNRSQTHRCLARVYRLQERFLLAARHFQKVTELDPLDIDAYVLAADSLAEAGKLDEARLTLERAKARTADAKAIRTLDELLLKLAEAGQDDGRIR